MRRRKPTVTMQINVRLDTELVRQLETRAKANRVTVSEEIRTKLIKPESSLSDFRAEWLRKVRDALEHDADPKDIEAVWQCLRDLEVKFAGFYTAAENDLSPYVRSARVRELLRGVPVALPDESKAKSKATQQE
jgi:hypothetical protein